MTAPRFDRSEGAGPLVRGFADGGFIVDGARYAAVLLTPEAASPWEPPALGELTPEDFGPLLALSPPPEFILLGSGSKLARPSPVLVRAFEARGIGVEVMDSRAAARTWAVLRAEERWIAAGLMPL